MLIHKGQITKTPGQCNKQDRIYRVHGFKRETLIKSREGVRKIQQEKLVINVLTEFAWLDRKMKEHAHWSGQGFEERVREGKGECGSSEANALLRCKWARRRSLILLLKHTTTRLL